MAKLASVHAVVRGQVQGVFFRAFVARHAVRLGVSGHVRNLSSGEVDVWAEGDTDKLNRLLDLLKTGPPAATVEEVKTSWSEYTGHYSDFKVR